MEFFTELNTIRNESDLPRKLTALENLTAALENKGAVSFEHDAETLAVGNPSFAKICKIVHGSMVEKRRNLGTGEGRIIFLHALAHIEYSAIDLALDSAYRFRGLPPQYYEDWFKVARDEARHFSLLQELLGELGSCYGALTVHTGIHDAMARSEASLRMRMAATHRHLEANGLDAHPELARKMAEFKDPLAQKITAVLRIIFEDEIDHVSSGDFWFRYACALDNTATSVFMNDVQTAIPGTKSIKKNLNFAARKRAGFTDAELAVLSGENSGSSD